jgi:hypothetical protein
MGASRTLAVLVALVLFPGLAAGQEREAALERWSRLDEEQRTVLRERFELFKGMNEGKRRELRDRHQRMKELGQDAKARLPKEVRRKLDSLGPDERREVMRDLLREESAERGQDLLERMPSEWRVKLQAAPAEERRMVLGEFKSHHRRRGLSRAIDKLGRELQMSPAQLQELREMAPEQQERRVLELHRSVVDARIARFGLPTWISSEEWDEWQALEPREFFERFNARRRERGVGPLPGLASEAGPGNERTRAAGWREPDADLSRLKHLMRPDPEWRLELMKLSPSERRTEMEKRVRARVLEFLDEKERGSSGERRGRARESNDLVRDALPSALLTSAPAAPAADADRTGKGLAPHAGLRIMLA